MELYNGSDGTEQLCSRVRMAKKCVAGRGSARTALGELIALPLTPIAGRGGEEGKEKQDGRERSGEGEERRRGKEVGKGEGWKGKREGRRGGRGRGRM